jgi:hypothetical protein
MIRVNDPHPVPTGDVAYYCCHLDANDDPDNCARYPGSGVCGVGTPTMLTVGKLWEDDLAFGVNDSIRESAQIIYASDPDKYYLFRDSGTWARVNY